MATELRAGFTPDVLRGLNFAPQRDLIQVGTASVVSLGPHREFVGQLPVLDAAPRLAFLCLLKPHVLFHDQSR
jgi:hypothetical protein